MGAMKFTESHEWIIPDKDGIVTIGISSHAQSQLGDIVFVELPDAGAKVEKGSQFGTIESTKAASELFSPVTGSVLEVNTGISDNPQWINESPHEKGWLIKVKMENPAEAESLMDESAYSDFIAKETH